MEEPQGNRNMLGGGVHPASVDGHIVIPTGELPAVTIRIRPEEVRAQALSNEYPCPICTFASRPAESMLTMTFDREAGEFDGDDLATWPVFVGACEDPESTVCIDYANDESPPPRNHAMQLNATVEVEEWWNDPYITELLGRYAERKVWRKILGVDR